MKIKTQLIKSYAIEANTFTKTPSKLRKITELNFFKSVETFLVNGYSLNKNIRYLSWIT